MKHNKNKMIVGVLFLFLLLIIICFTVLLHKHTNIPSTEIPVAESDNKPVDTITNSNTSNVLTASKFMEQINVGWNLGNSLDSCVDTGRNDGSVTPSYYETAWGNPPVTKELIDRVSQSGFKAIRFPVTWYYNTYVNENGKLCIQNAWLKRVKEVIDYAIENDMYVILDSHHDANIIWANMADIEEVSSNVSSLWEQIATYFKDYDEHLLFEGFNEINDKRNSWTYNEDSAEATNLLNQLFVDTVRNTGGYNTERILVCNTYLNEDSEEVLNSFVLPTDIVEDRLLIDIHSYNTSFNQDIDIQFKTIAEFSQAQKAPVIIGEFGTTDSFVPAEYRAEHAGNYIARANDYNLKCFWWDNGSNYKLFSRTDNTIAEEDIIYQLMHPQKFETNDISTNQFNSIGNYDYATISPSTGELISSEEGALTLNIGSLGFPIAIGYGYHIDLTANGAADGIRMFGIAFYNAHGNFLSYEKLNAVTTYDITPSTDACYMKITVHNGWGYRSRNEYENYLDNHELYLEISEYKK